MSLLHFHPQEKDTEIIMFGGLKRLLFLLLLVLPVIISITDEGGWVGIPWGVYLYIYIYIFLDDLTRGLYMKRNILIVRRVIVFCFPYGVRIMYILLWFYS